MELGKIYPVEIAQAVTALKLKAGHRLRIEIAGSNFPAYERNMQTGGRNALEGSGKAGSIRICTKPGRRPTSRRRLCRDAPTAKGRAAPPDGRGPSSRQACWISRISFPSGSNNVAIFTWG